MWEKLLFLLLMMILMTSLVESAEITCGWVGEVCRVSSITRVSKPNEIHTIAGKPSYYVNTATFYLSLHHIRPELDYIPGTIFSNFPRVSNFWMSSSSPKTTLLTNSIAYCANLNVLAIQDANVVNVPEGFVQAYTEIETIQLINAGVETVDENAFKGLGKLKSLQIMNNKISCFPPELFQTVPKIQSLELMSNKIKALDKNLFRNLPKLTYINLRNNLIASLPLFDFTGTALMGRFTISFPENPIYAFKPDFCNIFDSRPANFEDYFDVPNVKCFLANNPQTSVISRLNCRTTMASHLQNCYLNWKSSMNAPVTCKVSYIWQQILDYLKTKV